MYVNASRLAHAGGDYSSGADAGAFCLYVGDSASSVYAIVGSRLMFL